jgi:hypothetical protein
MLRLPVLGTTGETPMVLVVAIATGACLAGAIAALALGLR